MFHKKKYQSFETKLTQAKSIKIEAERPKKKDETKCQLMFSKKENKKIN